MSSETNLPYKAFHRRNTPPKLLHSPFSRMFTTRQRSKRVEVVEPIAHCVAHEDIDAEPRARLLVQRRLHLRCHPLIRVNLLHLLQLSENDLV